jgi:excisionase family DNA binding protein
MSFAGLQVCFLSFRPKTHVFSTEWNKVAIAWITYGKVHTSRRSAVMHKRKQPVTTVEPLLLTVPQVSVLLGLGRSKVYDLIEHEGLPTIKLGTARRIPKQALEAWLKQRIA